MRDNSAELDTHVDAPGGAELARNIVGPEPAQVDRGNQLLRGTFGSQDVSRQVACHAAQGSGLDPAFLRQMLPIMAMLVAGHLSGRSGRQHTASGSSSARCSAGWAALEPEAGRSVEGRAAVLEAYSGRY